MFSLGIRYLMGWAMAAADGAKKERAEWPPHPDRVFMALAAAWFETGKDAAEAEALNWLECRSAPKLTASGCELRRVVTHFVPVNDTSSPFENEKNGTLAMPSGDLQLGRPRRPRAFPVAIPHSPDVYLLWDEDIPEQHRESLTSLCRKVTSVGHSASLVQMWVEYEPPEPNLIPVPGVATHRLRVFGAGRLAYLETRLNRDKAIAYADLDELVRNAKGKEKTMLQERITAEFPKGKPSSLRPEPGLWQGYAPPAQAVEPEPSGGVFDHRLVVLALSGKQFPLPSTLKLTEALRGALLKGCPQPIPEWVSGHGTDGKASSQPHLAFLPLPFVGSQHADGRLMGVALALPRALQPAEAAQVLEPWLRDQNGQPNLLKLFNGKWLECSAELETREQAPYNLRMETWTRPAKRWASVTPVVLDRHFDGPNKWELAAESVKAACERAGFPRPLEVLLHPVSLIEGVPKGNEFPWMTRKKDGGRMHHAHAVIVFGEVVRGPVLVGAGRFRGYGLCRPLPQGGEGHD